MIQSILVNGDTRLYLPYEDKTESILAKLAQKGHRIERLSQVRKVETRPYDESMRVFHLLTSIPV